MVDACLVDVAWSELAVLGECIYHVVGCLLGRRILLGRNLAWSMVDYLLGQCRQSILLGQNLLGRGLIFVGCVLLDYTQGPFLTSAQKHESYRMLRLHLGSYQKLAARALREGRTLYKVRPKHHYSRHLADWVNLTGWNPSARSCFLDEDHMKFLAAVASRLHPNTLLLKFAKEIFLEKSSFLAERTSGSTAKEAEAMRALPARSKSVSSLWNRS